MYKRQYQNWRNIFYKNETRFFQEIEKSREKEFMLLYLYLRFAEDLYPAYKGAGIPDCVYYDTFSDLTVWSAVSYTHLDVYKRQGV